MMEQPFYCQIPPQGIIERPEYFEDPYSLPWPGTFQGPVGLGPSPMASNSLVPSVLPPADHAGFYDFTPMQTAIPWPVKNEGPDLSRPLPLRNTHVRNGQPTPPPYNDSNEQLNFGDLANYQVDGFQSVNVPAPALPAPAPPLAPVTYNGNVGQSPSAETDKLQSSPSPRRRRNHSLDATKEGVEKQSESRRKFLERNRLAASKCRQKKKDQSNDLQARCQREIEKKEALHKEASDLTSYRLLLKNQLFGHSNCGCGPIDAYLRQMVEDVTNKVVSGSQLSPEPVASEYIPRAEPDTSAFGFDGPAQFPPSAPEPWEEMARRASINSIATDFSYSLVDGESVGNVEPDVDFDSLLDVTECA